MAVYNEDSNSILFLCKYIVNSLVFMLDDVKLEMDPSNILSIELLNDFDQNLRSILKLNLRMDIRKKLWILKNKRDIVCKFELCKIAMNIEAEEFIGTPVTVWNEEFGIYFNDEEESTDTSVLVERLDLNDLGADADINNIDTENYFESQNMLEVYLFNQKLLDASTKTFNEVMTEDILQEYVARILSKTKHNKVLISKFENNEVYKELLIPALPAYKAIAYLDQYYGFYKKGSIIFYDVDKLYILNANGKCTAKEDKEWPKTTILVTHIEGSTPGNGMVIKEEEEIYYCSYPDENISFRKYSTNTNVTLGSETKLVLTDGTEIESVLADQSYINQQNSTYIMQHKDDNKYAADMMKARMEEGDIMLYLVGDNYDITAFKPNKEFNIIFDEQTKQDKYGIYGYRLSYVYHVIRLESVGYMSASTQIILKRRGEDD